MYILYFNNKSKILKTLFKVVLRYFFDWVYNNCLVALKDLSRCGQDTLCNIHCLWKLFNKKYFQRELTFLFWMKVNNWSFPIFFFRYIFFLNKEHLILAKRKLTNITKFILREIISTVTSKTFSSFCITADVIAVFRTRLAAVYAVEAWITFCEHNFQVRT